MCMVVIMYIHTYVMLHAHMYICVDPTETLTFLSYTCTTYVYPGGTLVTPNTYCVRVLTDQSHASPKSAYVRTYTCIATNTHTRTHQAATHPFCSESHVCSVLGQQLCCFVLGPVHCCVEGRPAVPVHLVHKVLTVLHQHSTHTGRK